jgi:hypothetical protein
VKVEGNYYGTTFKEYERIKNEGKVDKETQLLDPHHPSELSRGIEDC